MYEIIFCRDKKGKNEVEEYINELRKKSEIKECNVKLSKIVSYMRLLKEKRIINRRTIYKIFKRWHMGIKAIKR